jgi:hypothetical protein
MVLVDQIIHNRYAILAYLLYGYGMATSNYLPRLFYNKS